jgi:hypothetical protein
MLPHLGRAIDVGVDSWNFTPVHYEQVISFLRNKPISNHHPTEMAEIAERIRRTQNV